MNVWAQPCMNVRTTVEERPFRAALRVEIDYGLQPQR